MIFSLSKIRELMDVIKFYHIIFIGNNVDKKILSKNEINILKSNGIDIDKLPEETLVDYAYKFGVLSQALGDKRAKKLTFSELKKFIASKNYIPLTKSEEASLEFVKQQFYSDITGLGNRISKDFSQVAIEIDQKQRKNYEKIIKNETEKAVLYRKSVSELASEIGHKTEDWARDFDRISDYVMHNAYHQGVASELLEEYGNDVKVWYSVYQSACEHCQRIYLTNGIGSEPRVFDLVNVIENGSNIGRKTKDWKPTVYPIHPWCRCTMNHFVENSKWSDEKKQYIIERNNYGIQRRSKAKVKVELKDDK